MNKIYSKKKDGILACLAVLLTTTLLSCGGSTPGGQTEPESDVGETGATFSIGVEGGQVAMDDLFAIGIPPNAFSGQTNIILEEKNDADVLEDYHVSGVMVDAGISLQSFIKVGASSMPNEDIVVHYQMPNDFQASLGQDDLPRLFAKFYQTGADGEEIDYFEPLETTLEGNTVTAILPPEAFTDLRPDSSETFEAIVLMGSSPASGIPMTNLLGQRIAADRRDTGVTCPASSIGSPLKGPLEKTSSFGLRTDPITKKPVSGHYGVDLRASIGDEVMAVADGTIDHVGFNLNKATGKGWGHYVVLRHTDGSKTLYAHLLDGSTDTLKIGDSITKGSPIALVDSSGGVTGPHLHLEYAPNGQIGRKDSKIDPFPCIDSQLPGPITESADDEPKPEANGDTTNQEAEFQLKIRFNSASIKVGDHRESVTGAVETLVLAEGIIPKGQANLVPGKETDAIQLGTFWSSTSQIDTEHVVNVLFKTGYEPNDGNHYSAGFTFTFEAPVGSFKNQYSVGIGGDAVCNLRFKLVNSPIKSEKTGALQELQYFDWSC